MVAPRVRMTDISRIFAAEELGLMNLDLTKYKKSTGIIKIYEELQKKSGLTFEESVLESSIIIILNGNKNDSHQLYSRALEVYKILTQ